MAGVEDPKMEGLQLVLLVERSTAGQISSRMFVFVFGYACACALICFCVLTCIIALSRWVLEEESRCGETNVFAIVLVLYERVSTVAVNVLCIP